MSRGAKAGIWILALIVLIALFALTARRRMVTEDVQSIADIQKEQGIPVDIVVSRVVPMEEWRQFSGIAEGFEQVNLVAPFRTRIQSVHVRVGDEVAEGSVLVSLDPYDPARFAMNVRTTRTQYETARRDSIRMEALFASGAVASQELDHVRATTSAAHDQYMIARRAVELDTPISGMITNVSIEDDEYAAAEQSLVTVSSFDRVRIILDISESDRKWVRRGQVVRVLPDVSHTNLDGGGGTPGEPPVLKGEVVRVPLSADPESRLYPVEVVIENPDHHLRPGMLIAPEILLATVQDQPVIPAGAFVKQNGEEYIFILDESGDSPVARVRGIRRGIESGGMVTVIQGLSAGESVVVWGQNKIEDGSKVRVHTNLTETYYEQNPQ